MPKTLFTYAKYFKYFKYFRNEVFIYLHKYFKYFLKVFILVFKILLTRYFYLYSKYF